MLPMALNMPLISGTPEPEKMPPLAIPLPSDEGELPSQSG